MLKKTITYTDFNGNEVTEDLYFNLTKTEAVEFAMDLPDSVSKTFNDGTPVDVNQASVELVNQLGNKGVYQFVKSLVLKAYGIKSEDGKRFIKKPELTEEFEQGLAFDAFFMELMSDDKAAADFVNGVIPASLADQAKQITAAK
jgi:hypothetical protein